MSYLLGDIVHSPVITFPVVLCHSIYYIIIVLDTFVHQCLLLKLDFPVTPISINFMSQLAPLKVNFRVYDNQLIIIKPCDNRIEYDIL